MTLLEMLSECPLPVLRGIAERRGVALAAGQRAQVAAQLAAALAAPESALAAIANLSPEARRALDRLAQGGGRLPWAVFVRMAGPLRTFGAAAIETAAPWRHPTSATEELWYSGLLGRAFQHTEQGVIEFALIPAEALALLPPPAPGESAIAARPVSAPAHPWRAPGALLDDACTLLITVYQRAPRLVGQTWRRGDLAALQAALAEPDLAPLLLHLSERLGWTEAQHRRLRLAGEPVRAWLEQSRDAQARQLFEVWRDDAGWNDLCHVPGLRCAAAGGPDDPRRARRAVLRHLAAWAAAADGWWSVAALVTAIHDTDPDFQRPDGDYDAWYIQDATTGEYLRGFAAWPRVEGALIRWLVTGLLRALGVTATGADVAGAAAPTHFAITPLGRWLLGVGEPPAASAPAPFTVADDFTIALPPGHALLDRFRVARFAAVVAGAPLWTYRLERETLLAAQRRGLSALRVLDYLRQASGAPLPERVADALARLASPPKARARRVVALELDSRMRARLKAEAGIAALADTLPDGRMLVSADKWPQVEQWLRQLGVEVTLDVDG